MQETLDAGNCSSHEPGTQCFNFKKILNEWVTKYVLVDLSIFECFQGTILETAYFVFAASALQGM